jgi:hypothetical protein
MKHRIHAIPSWDRSRFPTWHICGVAPHGGCIAPASVSYDKSYRTFDQALKAYIEMTRMEQSP